MEVAVLVEVVGLAVSLVTLAAVVTVVSYAVNHLELDAKMDCTREKRVKFDPLFFIYLVVTLNINYTHACKQSSNVETSLFFV